MKITFSPTKVLLLSLVVLFQVGCSNDSDLLYDYVSQDSTSNPVQNSSNSNNTNTDSTNSGTDSIQTPDVTTPDSNLNPDLPGSDSFLGELKAFPEALGFGKNATGGRGGIVVQVTNLNTSGPGSLRAALEMSGARTIVFRVGGTIRSTGSDYFEIPVGKGDVTIAGETAPGDGIQIQGAKLRVRASNVIIRHMRFRQDPSTSSGSNDDAITIDGSGLSQPLRNIVLDHCSVAYGLDGNLDIRNTWGATVQYCIFSYNSKSNLINANSKDISYIKNIFALVDQRAVRANTIGHLDLTYEMINNFVYGVNWPGGPSEGLKVTVENNVCEESNETSTAGSSLVELAAPNPVNKEPNTIENTYLYVNGNDLGDSYSNELKPGLDQYRRSVPLYRSTYSPQSTQGIKAELLANAGAYATLPQGRDGLDAEIISNIRSKTGKVRFSGTISSLSSGTPYPDVDKDGMDDRWETLNNLNPNDPSDRNKDANGDGYTNLESFLHALTIGS